MTTTKNWITFFAFCAPVFAFHILQRSRQGRHLCEKSKDFVVYFFAALVKHEIHMKYEKCIVSVSYFVMCFAKYSRNAKYEKRIASLMICEHFVKNFFMKCLRWSRQSFDEFKELFCGIFSRYTHSQKLQSVTNSV